MTSSSDAGSAADPHAAGSAAGRRDGDHVAVKRLTPQARLPERAYHGDAAFDLFAAESCTLAPQERHVVGCGIALQLPAGTAALTLPRSGLAARRGLTLVNAPGLIDSGYRGEVRLILLNTDAREPLEIGVGDRVAQLLIISLPPVRLVEVDELSESERSTRGFGSSGV